MGNYHEAEDLTSQILFRAYVGFPKFQERGIPPIAWLMKIARNETVSYAREKKKGRGNEVTTTDTDWLDLRPTNDFAEDLPDYIEVQRAKEALKLVPDAQREVIIMRHVHEFSVRETARALGKEENNVKVLQHKGTTRLRYEFNILNSSPKNTQKPTK